VIGTTNSLSQTRYDELNLPAEIHYIASIARTLRVPPQDRHDVVQEVLLRAMCSVASFDLRLPVRPWLFGIVFRVVMELRRRTRHDVRPHDDVDTTDVGTPEHGLCRLETASIVRALFDALPLSSRALLIAFYVDEYTVSEIAEASNASCQNLYGRLRRARRQLREAAVTRFGGHLTKEVEVATTAVASERPPPPGKASRSM
jgi:RNA polymerase sigma factor (sigma-70 family)